MVEARPRRIFLIGPMGAGKSTIGRYLARKLGLRFLDSDTEIERRAGANIPWIFDVEGEEGFRDREVRVIEELTTRQGIVLATGGGAVMRDANRRVLAERGEVVFLRVSLEQQLERTAQDRKRPLLQVEDPASTLRRLKAIRDPLYLEIADHVVDANGESAADVAQKLARMLRATTA